MALTNLAWASGQVGGSVAGGRLADAATDAVPYFILAALCAVTLAAVRRARGDVPATPYEPRAL